MQTEQNRYDELCMSRAVELALLGAGAVSPNPLVGCVITADGKIIGEGWHERFGGPHAEVNAIASVQDKQQLRKAVVYVTLEPCAHHGKTPPCADLLIESEVKRVIVATEDSNPLVAGKGIKKLLDSGIEVNVGCLASQGRALNPAFFSFMEKKRPYIILKWAQTADHFISPSGSGSGWISNGISRKLVHKWRSREDAVLVGTNTASNDNPKLDVREWSGRNPVRIVIDRYLRLSRSLRLFDGTQKTICYNTIKSDGGDDVDFVKLNEDEFIQDMMVDLYHRKIQSVIVEGGRKTLDLFIDCGLWDEARIFTSSSSFGEGIEAPRLKGVLKSRDLLANDLLEIFIPAQSATTRL